MMHLKTFIVSIFLAIVILNSAVGHGKDTVVPYISASDQQYIIQTAIAYIDSLPVTVTTTIYEHSAGGPHDSTPDGLSLQLGAEFLFPFVKDKSTWPYQPDVMYFDEWPVRQPFLLFAGKAYNKPEYIELWETLNGYPKNREVIRNLPIRNPLIWLVKEPIKN